MRAENRQSTRNRVFIIALIVAVFSGSTAALAWNASSQNPQPVRRLAQATAARSPEGFTCRWSVEAPVHEYACAGDTEGPFRLSSHLLPGDPMPAHSAVGGWDGLAIPDTFSCALHGPEEPTDVIPAERFHCWYTHLGTAKDATDSRHGATHTHRFLLSEAVLVSVGNDPASDQEPQWVLPHHHAEEAGGEDWSPTAPGCRFGLTQASAVGQHFRGGTVPRALHHGNAADPVGTGGHLMFIPPTGC